MLQRLQPTNYLNDEVINAYIALLETRAANAGRNVHIYNSHFAWKILDDTNYTYGNIQNQSRKVSSRRQKLYHHYYKDTPSHSFLPNTINRPRLWTMTCSFSHVIVDCTGHYGWCQSRNALSPSTTACRKKHQQASPHTKQQTAKNCSGGWRTKQLLQACPLTPQKWKIRSTPSNTPRQRNG